MGNVTCENRIRKILRYLLGSVEKYFFFLVTSLGKEMKEVLLIYLGCSKKFQKEFARKNMFSRLQ